MTKRQFIAALIYIASPAHAQVSTPLPIDVALGQPEFPPYQPIAVSPDGRWVAYTLRNPSRIRNSPLAGRWFTTSGVTSVAVGARVWITAIGTGESLPLGAEASTSWGPAWSPDGKLLAFYSDADGVARLWLRDVATRKVRKASDVIVRGHRGFEVPRWTPDSRSLVVPILPVGETLPELVPAVSDRSANSDTVTVSTKPTVTVLRADSTRRFGGGDPAIAATTDSRGSLRADLALVDIATGSVTTVAHGYWPLDFSISPDGRYLAFSSEQPRVLRPRYIEPADVVVAGLQKESLSTPRTIARNLDLGNLARNLIWSPDGTRLLYSAIDTADKEEYFVADAKDWQPRQVGTVGVTLDPEVHPSSNRSLWWDPDGRSFYIVRRSSIVQVSMPAGTVESILRAPPGYATLSLVGADHKGTAWRGDDRSVLAMFHNDSTKRMGFARVVPGKKSWRVVREQDNYHGDRLFGPTDVAGRDKIVFVAQDSQHPTDIWEASVDFSRTRQVSHISPNLEHVRFGATQLIEWKTTSGSPRRGTLLMPAGYRKGNRYPLVVYPYPAVKGSDHLNEFGVKGTGIDNMQLFATRGFAVLVPDVPPISYTEQMRELAAIILPGVDRVIELGIADSTRIGVMGHSWGGYTVLALLVQTRRFRAAVMRGGHGDEVAGYGILQTTGYASGAALHETFFGGPPWEQRDRYLANSPIFHFDRITTPLLIIHGESETTVPIFLANQVFASLQRLGKEVEFARYAGENHNEALWTAANQRDFLIRLIDWFETKLESKRGNIAAERH